jgi:hypothetical protein
MQSNSFDLTQYSLQLRERIISKVGQAIFKQSWSQIHEADKPWKSCSSNFNLRVCGVALLLLV